MDFKLLQILNVLLHVVEHFSRHQSSVVQRIRNESDVPESISNRKRKQTIIKPYEQTTCKDVRTHAYAQLTRNLRGAYANLLDSESA